MSPTGVSVILGTMTFGWARSSGTVDSEVSAKMMDMFFDAGHTQVDTALTYSSGKTEEILGEICPPGSDRSKRMGILATKAGPWMDASMLKAGGGLGKGQVRAKVEQSLKSMKRDSVDLLYLHAPDPDTRIEDTLAEVHELHKEGKFKSLGLSNFQAWEVAHIYHTCKANGYVTPTVYQGMYNAITRDVEKELLPCLRKLGISFYAYNPLAGGVLTGKHSGGEPEAGRFKDNAMYISRFWKDAYFDAVKSLQTSCKEEGGGGVSLGEASLRWLATRSQLTDGDAIIIGASNLAHLEQNLGALGPKGGVISDGLASAFDDAWEMCRRECPPYARGCSKSC